ncbi:hypothetical protein GWI33_014950 [Rhynchophorus ferrugineus]|uniref:Sphingomyelin phosphodiesterase n=1 Tax=Rhynchophorus ferrugineus TaxID=354439 RepID=A0A834I4T3_RHYFE|nr:hypothetical protein GWI33_014950 [Rhynchophorus ferrugineus]
MYKLLLLVVSVIVLVASEKNYTKYLQIVEEGFQEYQKTGSRPSYLNEALRQFRLTHLFRENVYIGNTARIEVPQIQDDTLCSLCGLAADFVVFQIRLGTPRDQLKNEVAQLCELFDIEPGRVCEGVVELNIDAFIYIFTNDPDLNPDVACHLLLQSQCPSDSFEWTIDVPDGQSPSRPKPTEKSLIKVLHVSDIHLDTLYREGKVATCSEPVCCQEDQDDGDESTGNVCGYWSSYGNDVTEHLVDEFIRFANTLDFDYVYFTGDIISHRVWSTSEENNAKVITTLMDKFKSGFKVPVYPILGNHEPSPLNLYIFENTTSANLSTQWLLDLVEKEWSEWLPDSTSDTIAKGGFYTVSPREGFRIIVINSNVAYIVCWWLLKTNKDPYGQLDWLVSILEQAERYNESVHILSHIPTGGSEIMNTWSREYNKIVNRFANTIKGQFNGHIHVDQFQVHYNSDESKATNVAWNGASLVPYDFANPSFKIYSVDSTTFDVVDIDQWTFNLTEANLNKDKSPNWYKIYSFKKDYDVTSLQPEDIGDLLVKMAKDHNYLADYHLHRYKNSDRAAVAGCDSNCQKNYLCNFSTYLSGDTTKCNELKEIYDKYS